MTEAPDISVVIVSYRCKEVLVTCLEALAAQQGPQQGQLRTEVIVVDNASGDGTTDLLRSRFPDVRLVERDTNSGFGRASNHGIALSTAPTVLLLNPDAILPPDALARCHQALWDRPEVGMLGCRLVRADGSLDHACKRGFPSPADALRYFLKLDRRDRAGGAGYRAGQLGEHEAGPVDAISGAFMLIKREALERTGAFDEAYWMYGEDLDLCFRFWQAGWEILYWPEVTAVHLKGVSSGRHRSLRLNYQFHWAMWHFFRTHQWHATPLPVALVVSLGIWARFLAVAVASATRRAQARLRRPRPAVTGSH